MSIHTYQQLRGLGISDRRVVEVLPTIVGGSYHGDEVIWPKGDVGQPWSYIFSGIVCGCLLDQDGAYQVICLYGPGAWIGENSVINNEAAALEYVCMSDVRLMHVPIAVAQDAYMHEGDFSRFVGRLAATRSQLKSELLQLMRTGSTAQRVVCSLALHAETFIEAAPQSTRYMNESQLTLPLKQAMLASLCGVSRSAFSTCIKQLADAGWCTVQYSALSLHKTKTWSHFAKVRHGNRHNLQAKSIGDLLQALDAASLDCADTSTPIALSA